MGPRRTGANSLADSGGDLAVYSEIGQLLDCENTGATDGDLAQETVDEMTGRIETLVERGASGPPKKAGPTLQGL